MDILWQFFRHFYDVLSWFSCSRLSNDSQGFPKGFLLPWGREISIIGVARALVAISNFVSNPCDLFRVYIGFNKELPHKKRKTNYCNRCAHDPNHWDFPPSQNPPWKPPKFAHCQTLRTRILKNCMLAWTLEIFKRFAMKVLWNGRPPNSTETQKELKWPKSDSKVTFGVPAQSDTKWPKSDSKVAQK